MFLPLIIYDYFLWHYTRAWRQLWGVWRNYLWFVIHVFSLPQLLRSLFSPFKRITEQRGNTWNLEDLAAYIVIGALSRIVGLVSRSAIILVGLVALMLTLLTGITIFLTWAIVPLIIVGLLGGALSLFFISV